MALEDINEITDLERVAVPVDQNLQELKKHGELDFPVMVYPITLTQAQLKLIRNHKHPEIEMLYVQQGKLKVQINEETIILTPGQGAFINRDTLHSFHRLDEQDVTFYCIVFHPGIIFGYGTNSLSVKYLSPVLDNPTLKHRILYKEDAYTAPIIDFMNKIHDDYFEGNFGFELACKAHICNMWNSFLQIPRDESNPTVKPKQLLNDEQRIKDAIIYIEQHLADPITLDDIARSIHISKSECCRCFKRVLKQSPFEYLLKHRILHAAKLIRHRDPSADSISNLAITVGFGNISYFNKIFKRYMHMTPTEYKKEQSEIK